MQNPQDAYPVARRVIDQDEVLLDNTGCGKVTAPIFLLVPQVKLPKRLDLDRDAERALDNLPGLIVANWVEERLI